MLSVKLGRLDAAVPDVYDTNPTDNDSVQTRMAKFIAMGMGLRDFVALMGANTLGSSDSSTPRVFDSALFKDISSSNALRAADASLMNDPRTASWVSW